MYMYWKHGEVQKRPFVFVQKAKTFKEIHKDMQTTHDDCPAYSTGFMSLSVEEAALKMVKGLVFQKVPLLKLKLRMSILW